jgi:dTDP-4-amino-4,6-dideoxygalactose transaminase
LIDCQKLITPFRKGDQDTHVYHQYTLKIINGKRDSLVKHLSEKGIPCGIYYPIPLHSQKAYASKLYKSDDFKVTLEIVNQVISLPMHTELADDQIDFITDTIKSFLG